LEKEELMVKKICILTTVHAAFDIRIFHKEAITLSKHGYDVTLIAQHDKYEITNGIKIIPLKPVKNRFVRMTKNVLLIFRMALKTNADIFHFHDPELIPIGISLSFLGKHVVYDIHEDVPKDIKDKFWIPPYVRGILSRAVSVLESFAARKLSGLITATPSIALRFPPDKTAVVQNLPILQDLERNLPYQKRLGIVAYIGNLTEVRGAKEMIAAMDLLPESLDVKLTIAGAISSISLENEMRQISGWNRVKFLGWIDREGVSKVLTNARVGLILFHPVANHTESQPNKIFEYMQAGIPVIASNFSLWRQIIEGAGCGIMVDPFDINGIADAIKWLLENPKEAEILGEKGRQAVIEKYNWGPEGENLTRFYERIEFKR
jgi:glycosyltransferase involved in cell wall biosynthesis